MLASLPPNKISVVTMHKVPEFFNNDLVTLALIMKDYPIRYQSLAVNYFTVSGRLYNSLWVNTDDALHTANGEWVTVYLPARPRLTPSQAAQVRSLARAANFNVIQLPPESENAPRKPASLAEPRHPPEGDQLVLQLLDPEHAVLVAEPQLQNWSKQTSPAFFASTPPTPGTRGRTTPTA